VVEKLLKIDPENPQNWLRKAYFLWKFKGDVVNAEQCLIKASDLDPTPISLTNRITFVREVRDDIREANKLQRTVIFNLDYRRQERWEFFVRNDNEAFTQQHKRFVKKVLDKATKISKKLLLLGLAGDDDDDNSRDWGEVFSL